MRPRDPDCMVLTVEPPKQYLEPDSPKSTDQLIGPITPDLVKISAEVPPEIAQPDPKKKDKTGASKLHNLETWPGEKPETLPPKSVFDYDVSAHAADEAAQTEATPDDVGAGACSENDVDAAAHLLSEENPSGAQAQPLSPDGLSDCACAPDRDTSGTNSSTATPNTHTPNKTSLNKPTTLAHAKTAGTPPMGGKPGGYAALPDSDTSDPWQPRLPAEQPRLMRTDRRAPQPKILYENLGLPSESACGNRDNKSVSPSAQKGGHGAPDAPVEGTDSGVMVDLKRGTTIGRYDIKDSQWLWGHPAHFVTENVIVYVFSSGPWNYLNSLFLYNLSD